MYVLKVYRKEGKSGFCEGLLEVLYIHFQEKLGDISFLYVDNKILSPLAESYSLQFCIERLLTGEPESSKRFHEKLKKKEGHYHYN